MIKSTVKKPQPQSLSQTIESNPYDKFGAGAESKLRLEEATTGHTTKANAAYYAAPLPEGRMRVQEQSRFISPDVKPHEIERRHIKPMPERKSVPERKVVVADRKPITSAVTTAPKPIPKNPFDDDDDSKNNYDESKNPFADDDDDVPSSEVAKEKSNSDKKTLNPFGEYESD